jgi:hypothetical protein
MATYAQVQDRLQYLRDVEEVPSLQGYSVTKSKAILEAKLAEVEAELAESAEEDTAIAPPESNQVEIPPCKICGSEMTLDDNWIRCTACPHKDFFG